MLKKRIFLTKLIFFTAALFSFSLLSAKDESEKMKFSTVSLDGTKADERIFSEREITMVNVWGTFCAPCIREMPALARLNKEYGEKFAVIGFPIDVLNNRGEVQQNKIKTAENIIRQTGADYEHLIPTEDLMNTTFSSIMAIPAIFFVDRNGKIISEIYFGAKSFSEWKSITDGFLGVR